MLLRYTAKLEEEARAVETAIERVLGAGQKTRDLGGTAGTRELGERIVREIAPAPIGPIDVHTIDVQTEERPAPRTLLDKLWDAHVVCVPEDRPPLLYIDLHLVHEVTSPQAFEGLRVAGRRVRGPDRTVATVDHNVPTLDRSRIDDPLAAKQIETLR